MSKRTLLRLSLRRFPRISDDILIMTITREVVYGWVGTQTFGISLFLLRQLNIFPALLLFSVLTRVFFISFVYGFNTEVERRVLWNELSVFSSFLTDSAWTICGDFNSYLSTEEKEGGNVGWTSDMTDFKIFTVALGLTDLRSRVSS